MKTMVTVELEVESGRGLRLSDLTRALEDVDVHDAEPGVGLRTYATVQRATIKKAEVRMRGGRIA